MLNCVGSFNSFGRHSSMHAPSRLARAFVGECCGAGGVGVCGGFGVSGTARMDESLHDGVHSVPACSPSIMERGHELRGEAKRSRRGT